MRPGPVRKHPMDSYQTYESDILVVGAGGAGLRAVVAAREAGCQVRLVCK